MKIENFYRCPAISENLRNQIMSYRFDLQFPAQFDCTRSLIKIFYSDVDSRFIRTVDPLRNEFDIANDPGGSALLAYEEKVQRDAATLWETKYHCRMPHDVRSNWAMCLPAAAIPYVGNTKLTAGEWAFVQRIEYDVTLTDLWFIVEGLGWRPGTPVREDDEKWIAVWAEELECPDFLQSVRIALGMSEAPYNTDPNWLPPAVAKLKKKGSLKERQGPCISEPWLVEV